MNEEGQWTVDSNEDDTGIILEFAHMGEAGVETFTTSMPPGHALVFAAAVLNWVLELSDPVKAQTVEELNAKRRQAVRQIELFLEDGDRNRLIVCLALLDDPTP